MLRKLAKATDEVKEIHEEVKIINSTHTHTPSPQTTLQQINRSILVHRIQTQTNSGSFVSWLRLWNIKLSFYVPIWIPQQACAYCISFMYV